MKIVELNGGLGNQIAQYIFSRYLEISYGYDNVILDNQYFSIAQCHNGYELDLFSNAKLNLISKNFDNDVWLNMVDIYIQTKAVYCTPNVFYANGVDLTLICDEYWYNKSKNKFITRFIYDGPYHVFYSNEFYNNKLEIYEKIKDIENIYFKGVWLNDSFGKEIKKEIQHELKFPELKDIENIEYKEKILASKLSVGIHVRRGDFISTLNVFSEEKYAKSIKELKLNFIKSQNPKPTFFIFSDDINWCKQNKSKLGLTDNDDVIFIEGNDVKARNYIDMQLMTFCDYLVHDSKSSFCLAAQMISEKQIKRIKCYSRDN